MPVKPAFAAEMVTSLMNLLPGMGRAISFPFRGSNAALNFRRARENFIKNSSDFHSGLAPFPHFCGFWRQERTETRQNSASGERIFVQAIRRYCAAPWHRARCPRRGLAARDAQRDAAPLRVRLRIGLNSAIAHRLANDKSATSEVLALAGRALRSPSPLPQPETGREGCWRRLAQTPCSSCFTTIRKAWWSSRTRGRRGDPCSG